MLHIYGGGTVQLIDACSARDGEEHICMRGARIDRRPEFGPHLCACGHRWTDQA